MKKTILSVFLAGIWISLSEFIRNEFLLKSFWTAHYEKLGMVFPSEPINGAVWGIWSICFATLIYFISRHYSLLQTTAISWFAGFVLMWLVVGNMNVLPFGILPFAIPLSILEAFVASWLVMRTKKND